jgi:hypothetical protein
MKKKEKKRGRNEMKNVIMSGEIIHIYCRRRINAKYIICDEIEQSAPWA